MSAEPFRNRWRWAVFFLPLPAAVGAMLAGEWHLVGELNQWLESLLPAGTPAIPARAPLIGWLTLTVGCAMWLTYDWHRDRNSGARLWTRVMYLTPFMAALQGLIAAICASSIQFFFFEGLRLR